MIQITPAGIRRVEKSSITDDAERATVMDVKLKDVFRRYVMREEEKAKVEVYSSARDTVAKELMKS